MDPNFPGPKVIAIQNRKTHRIWPTIFFFARGYFN